MFRKVGKRIQNSLKPFMLFDTFDTILQKDPRSLNKRKVL